MAQMAVANPNNIQIQIHQGPFAPDESCIICNRTDSEALQLAEQTSNVMGTTWSTLKMIPKNRSLVHASCHPQAPYHYECLKGWLAINATCPLDRKDVDLVIPTKPPVTADYKQAPREVQKVQAFFKNAFNLPR